MAQREYKVEDYLVERVGLMGGACEKYTNPGHRGDPDRLLSFPCRYHCLVETKWAQGVKPMGHQLRRHGFWRLRGMDVYVVGSEGEVDVLLQHLHVHHNVPFDP
jgi:hypothetical protein